MENKGTKRVIRRAELGAKPMQTLSKILVLIMTYLKYFLCAPPPRYYTVSF
jgi:hypothetical protein